MSVQLTANASVASDVVTGQETIHEGVISTLQTTPAEVSGVNTSEIPQQSIVPQQLGNFFQRRTLINQRTFTSTDVANTLLQQFDPHGLFFSSVPIMDKTKNFKYFRGTLKITVTSSFPSGAYGLYCVSAVPEGGPVLASIAGVGTRIGETLPYQQCLHVPHVLIRVENATDGVITLPFIYPYDYCTINSTPTIHTVSVWCLQPVTSAMADTTLTGNMTIYAEFLPDFEMVVPVQQGKKGGVGSQVKHAAGTISSIATTLSSVPVIGEFAAPIAAGAAAVSSVLDWFGFTRTTHQKTPETTIPRLFSNVANIDCEDTGEICALSVSNTISFDPRIGGGQAEDEAAFESIFQHWTQVDQFTWTNAQTAGTTIGSFNVSPFYTNSASAYNATIALTSAGYVGLPFSHWRGDMEYMVIIPVSMFHRGKIQFVWALSNALGAHDPTNQMYNIIMDVTAQTDLKFSVGYSLQQPTCESRVHSSTYPAISSTSWFNGTVSVRVVNPLIAPVDSAPTVIRIYARAKSNMQFGVPKSIEEWSTNVDPLVSKYDISWAPQGAVGDGERDEVIMELVPSSGDYPACELLWGENIKSVRALMQKIEPLYQTVNEDSDIWYVSGFQRQCTYLFNHFPNYNRNFLFSQDGFATFAGGDAGGQVSLAGWYKYLFVGIAGSTRYKIIASGPHRKNLQASLLNAPLSVQNTYSATFAVEDVFTANSTSADTVIDPGHAYEFTVPYYAQQKYYHCRYDVALTFGTIALPSISRYDCLCDIISTWAMYANPAENNLFGNKIYRGMGPDLRLTTYRFPPLIRNNVQTYDYFTRRTL